MRPTYYLEFELTYNTWTNLISDWRATVPLIIERGMAAGGRVANIGSMTLALHNPDGRYTVGHANARAGFEAGIGVRLRVTDGAITETLFYGRLAAITHHTTDHPHHRRRRHSGGGAGDGRRVPPDAQCRAGKCDQPVDRSGVCAAGVVRTLAAGAWISESARIRHNAARCGDRQGTRSGSKRVPLGG